jgi:hypothetical protein
MGQENSGTDQTHYCRHRLKHRQRPLRHCATENGGHLAQSKRFPGTNTRSCSTEDSAQQVLSISAIVSINQTENHPHDRLRLIIAVDASPPLFSAKKQAPTPARSLNNTVARTPKFLARNHKTIFQLFPSLSAAILCGSLPALRQRIVDGLGGVHRAGPP